MIAFKSSLGQAPLDWLPQGPTASPAPSAAKKPNHYDPVLLELEGVVKGDNA